MRTGRALRHQLAHVVGADGLWRSALPLMPQNTQ
jgi:hypothetical protein